MSEPNRNGRRRVLQGIGAMLGGSAVAATGTGTAGADDGTDDASEDGFVTIEGGESVEESVACIERAIEDAGLLHVTTIDHAANAASIGEELRPTTLLIFGNPEAGTPLMQERQSIGIDLPQKMLIWEDVEGGVNVTYNDPEYLAARHGIEEQDERLEAIGEALAMLAESSRNGVTEG